MLESFLEKKLVDSIKKLGGQAFKFVSPGMAGVPDRIVLLPGGRMFFVELKKPGQKLRPLQLKRKKDLEVMGFQVEVVDSIESIDLLDFAIRLEQAKMKAGDPFRD